jgi:hypothetical protein
MRSNRRGGGAGGGGAGGGGGAAAGGGAAGGGGESAAEAVAGALSNLTLNLPNPLNALQHVTHGENKAIKERSNRTNVNWIDSVSIQ